MSEMEAGSAISPAESLVGVRLAGSSGIRFCRTDGVQCSVGDWVLVDGEELHHHGRVVVAADGWRGSPDAPSARVARRLRTDEVASLGAGTAKAAIAKRVGPEIGSTGPQPSNHASFEGSIEGSLSAEDDTFRRAKRSLPVLGQAVRTRQGGGRVIAIDVGRRAVTCELYGDGSEIDASSDELSWVSRTTLD